MIPDEVEFLNSLSAFNNVIVFSPHFDDAILSMGGLLSHFVKSGKNIKVINVFTKSFLLDTPLTQRLLRQANMSNVVTYFLARIDEDKEAFKKLGIKNVENLGFIDGAWRIGENKFPLYPQFVKGGINPDDRIEDLIRIKISKMKIDPSNNIVFAPLARGKHVDHQIVRNIVCSIFENVIYYSDFPYSQKYGNEDDFINKYNLSYIDWQIDSREKMDLVSIYKTQLVSNLQGQIPKLPFERYYLSNYRMLQKGKKNFFKRLKGALFYLK